MEDQKKDNRAMLIGVALILVVLGIFFFRSYQGNKKEAVPEAESKPESDNFASIIPQELAKKISAQEKMQLIDIRPVEEYEMEHLLDSISLPFLSTTEFSTVRIKKDSPLVIISNTGEDENVRNAYQKIKSEGYQDIFVLEGGLVFWKAQNLSTVSWGDPQSFVNQSKVIYLEAESLKKSIDSGSVLYILDVRTKDEYSKNRIPRAVNIPLGELETRRNEIPISKSLIVYGASELESFQAGVRLHDIGFPENRVLKGGIETWISKGYPTEK